MRKFKQIDYEIENDGRALDKVMAFHVKDIFRMLLKKFQDRRKVWEHYLAFVKQKFPNSVTTVYQELLRYHHETDDFIEAANHEMSKDNYTVASSILLQGMGLHKESSKQLVVMYIECSIKQGEMHDESARNSTLLQASKFYEKFLKNSDVKIICNLLRKIEGYNYSMTFQNTILKDLITHSASEAEIWELLASRQLHGLIFQSSEPTENESSAEAIANIPFDARLRYAIAIYEKSLCAVDGISKKTMYEFYIKKLLEVDAAKDINATSLKISRQSLAKTLIKGFEENCLSEKHFIVYLQLRMLNIESNTTKIEEMLEKGLGLYSSSLKFYELAIKFFLETKSYEKVSQFFNIAVSKIPKNAIELYHFLCGVCLHNKTEKDIARNTMKEAISSSNKQLSQAFQPYYIEYVALTESIESARKEYNSMLQTRAMSSLSLDLFKIMIKLEGAEEKPNDKFITNCFERATEQYGHVSSEVNK